MVEIGSRPDVRIINPEDPGQERKDDCCDNGCKVIEIKELKDSHDSCNNNNNNNSNLENKVMKDKENEDDIIRDFKQGKDPHLLVATLIATVAFAAGFTMPGGYISEKGDDDRGQAILTSSKAFQAFVITDTIALMLSGFAILAHIFALVIHKKKVIHRLFMTQFYFTSFALLAMVLAFLTGIYAVLSQSSALAISTCVIGSVYSAAYMAATILIYFDERRRQKNKEAKTLHPQGETS